MSKLIALIIYVRICDDNEEILNLKDYLAIQFEMKDLGGLTYFLFFIFLYRIGSIKTGYVSILMEICSRFEKLECLIVNRLTLL